MECGRMAGGTARIFEELAPAGGCGIVCGRRRRGEQSQEYRELHHIAWHIDRVERTPVRGTLRSGIELAAVRPIALLWKEITRHALLDVIGLGGKDFE